MPAVRATDRHGQERQVTLISAAQAPLYEIKANLFKALAHPARIRILELLSAAPDTLPL